MADLSAIPPWIPRNSRGEPYSPELKSMPAADKAGVEQSRAAIRTMPWAQRGVTPVVSATPGPAPAGDAVDVTLAPIIRRESGGNPNVGWTGVDLSKVPLDATGFPIWSGRPGPKGNSTAAGLYQIVGSTWRPIAKQLGITDFSPESQRRVARELYRQRGLTPWAESAGGGSQRMGGRFGGAGPRVPGAAAEGSTSGEAETLRRRYDSLANALKPPPNPAPMEAQAQPEAVAPAAAQAPAQSFRVPSLTMPPMPNLHNLYRTALGRILGAPGLAG